MRGGPDRVNQPSTATPPSNEHATRNGRVVAASAVLLAVAVILVIAFRIDVSAARDFRRDAIVRDAFRQETLPPTRFYDPSPISIWLSFDWFVWDSVRAGHLPLWERLQGGG